MQDLIGRTLGHYRIVEKIGEGGMGEVYRATDTKLGREVAFKVLPEEMASDPEWFSRFQREAKTVAALNHPNIVTLFSVEEADGTHFLTMELVEGKALKDLLPADGFSLDRLLALATPLADAVASAHSRGIIHRDLKPANVMVADEGSRVKVLDFGIAKMAESSSADGDTELPTLTQTQAGRVVGTPHYMSPEQARGDRVDHRSDIFSLGVMLYEMATGKRPFKGASAIELRSSVLKDIPPVVTEIRPELPNHLGRVLGRCLEKSPADRYQTARDVYNELKGLREETSSPRSAAAAPGMRAADTIHRRSAWHRPSPRLLAALAVLLAAAIIATGWLWSQREATPAAPIRVANRVVVAEFENRTEDPSLDHLGRTIAATLTQGLSEIGEIDLLPARPLAPTPGEDRASTFRRLAEETGASLIVTGDYFPQETGLRLQVRVTSAETMRLLYGVDEISASRAFPEETLEEVRQRIMGLTTILCQPSKGNINISLDLSVETWSLYYSEPPRYDALMEFQAGWNYFGHDYPKALQHFQRAADLDPGYFWANLEMASAYTNLDQYPKADAIVASWEGRRQGLAGAARDTLDWLRAAIDGRNAEALQRLQALARRLPQARSYKYLVGATALSTNRPELAVEMFASYLDVEQIEEKPNPNDLWGRSLWLLAYHLNGNYEQELSLARRMSEHHPQSLALRLGEVRALIALGKMEELDRVLEEAQATPSNDTSPGDVFYIAARELRAHGRPEEALPIANLAVDLYRQQSVGEAATAQSRVRLGAALCLAQRWRKARSVFAEVAEGDPFPWNLEALGHLGVVAARLGEQDDAQRISQRLAVWEYPYLQGRHTYWRASIAAALGDRDDAVRFLRQAFAEGLPFTLGDEEMRHDDMNLDPLRGYPPFDRLMAPKERSNSK